MLMAEKTPCKHNALEKMKVLCFGVSFIATGDIMSEFAPDSSGEGSANLRRERLRSWLRHERLAMRMVVVEAMLRP